MPFKLQNLSASHIFNGIQNVQTAKSFRFSNTFLFALPVTVLTFFMNIIGKKMGKSLQIAFRGHVQTTWTNEGGGGGLLR